MPFDGEQTVTLKISESAVVGKNIKSIVNALERASRTVSAIIAITDVRVENLGLFGGAHLFDTHTNLGLWKM